MIISDIQEEEQSIDMINELLLDNANYFAKSAETWEKVANKIYDIFYKEKYIECFTKTTHTNDTIKNAEYLYEKSKKRALNECYKMIREASDEI